MDPNELESLSRDLRSALGDLVARGVRQEPIGARAQVAPTRPDDRSEAVSAWSDIARGARASQPTGGAALRAIREELGDCKRCELCRTRTQLVFGVGSPDADLVVVGEGPGHQEDLQGEPFVGPAGQMLDNMLAKVVGVPRPEAYILNVVKCRPPRNRNPLPVEVAACRPFLAAQIRALQPKIILVLGSVAYKTLMATSEGITRARGRWQLYRDPSSELKVPVMPTFHPAYLLRKPEDKRLTFADLKAVKQRYDDEGGRRS